MPIINKELSSNLEDRYGVYGLKRAFVRDVGDLPNSMAQASDIIHENLADAASKVLRDALFMLRGEAVGVGSGRGPAMTCFKIQDSFLLRPYELRPEYVRVIPLSGYLSASRWEKGGETLDAGTAAVALGNACCRADIQMLPMPIALSDTFLRMKTGKVADAQEFANTYDLPISLRKWYPNELDQICDADYARPRLCIVGVGILVRPGHRLLDKPEETRPVWDDISELQELIGNEEPCPVGDLCNHLFVMPLGHSRQSKIERVVEKVNSRLLTVTEEHFRLVDTVVIVAGGYEKVDAIRHILQERIGQSKWLFTDSDCCRALLQ